jgi:hypothetical protein
MVSSLPKNPIKKVKPVKKKSLEPDEDGMLPEYDFSGPNVVRGKHYREMQQGYTVRIHNEDGTITVQHFGPNIRLDADVAVYFPDAESVNKALHVLISIFSEMQANEKKQKRIIREQTAKSPAARK